MTGTRSHILDGPPIGSSEPWQDASVLKQDGTEKSASSDDAELKYEHPTGFPSVENIKSWLDDFYKIPCSKLVGQPFHFWSQMIMSITPFKYLSTLEDPEWDCQAVRNTVHLISTMDFLLQNLDKTSKEPALQCNDHLLKYLSKLLTKCRLWAEGR
ncbi:hypothetical protein GX50_02353 [[Emmonsia] crescens]|uniref:Uncharacterized protein n=1 Tax=[Emmonsia] crescens TaxID=73230 RepID=A0A2B7ZE91_9EURO|nr:hypothetical protein GX50_02353 [Emmonsia crescens]